MTNSMSIKINELKKLPGDFQQIITKFQKESPSSVKTFQDGRFKKITVDIQPGIQLLAYQSKTNGVELAYYVAFDPESNTCYKRNLIC